MSPTRTVLAMILCAAAPLACSSDGADDADSADTDGTTTDVEASDTTTTASDTSTSRSSTETSGADAPIDNSPVNSAAELGPLQFELSTANNDITVRGSSDGCTNPSETTLDVTFSDGQSEVVISAEAGEGSVIIPGLFEGTIDEIAVGDIGNVMISGRGGLADDSAEATTFEVLGNCI